MPAQVGRQRPVGFAREVPHDLVPAAPGLREAVQQEERLGHPAIMPAGPDTHLLLRAFVDELARCGVREACTSPGSRCSPIVLALVRDGRLRCHSHIDERCAGFFAVGAAKASQLPVAITCTSGTAAANLAPAVIEAWEARVPLIVLTADRPPELRDVGAGQAIDQLGLYGVGGEVVLRGRHARGDARAHALDADARLPRGVDGARRTPRPRAPELGAARAARAAGRARPDPIGSRPPRSGGRPWLLRSTPGDDSAAAGRALAVLARDAHRPLVVAGRAEPGLEAIAPACERLGWPLLADPLSGARRGAAAVAHYDLLLRSASFCAAQRPDLVIRCGDLPTSKPLRAWLDGLDEGVTQLAFDPQSSWHDPSGSLQLVLAADAAATLVATAGHAPSADPAWLAAWRDADARAAAAIDGVLGDELSEPRVARELGAVPAGRARRCSSPRRCRSATSRATSPCATTRRACSATAARTASTAPCRARSAPPRSATGRSCC